MTLEICLRIKVCNKIIRFYLKRLLEKVRMAHSGFMLQKEQVANDALISIKVRPFDSRMDWKQDLDLEDLNTLQVSQACK